MFIRAKTTKGQNTIKMCKLFTPIYAEERRKIQSIDEQEHYKKILLKAIEIGDPTLIEQINNYIDSS